MLRIYFRSSPLCSLTDDESAFHYWLYQVGARSGYGCRSAGALFKIGQSAGAPDKNGLERGAEIGVGMLERWWKIGWSAGALIKRGRSAGALFPLHGPQDWFWFIELVKYLKMLIFTKISPRNGPGDPRWEPFKMLGKVPWSLKNVVFIA